jgi:3-methyladenine DNA glycosylase AlkD
MTSATDELLSRASSVADPSRAEQEQAYLKSDRDFLGVGVPALRRVVKDVVGDLAIESHDEVVAVALEWWDGPYFECRRASVEVLMARVGVLDDDDLPLIEALVRDGETWAINDGLAGDVAGRILARGVAPAAGELLDRWSVDPDSFWVRRLSMLSLLLGLKRAPAGEEPTEWRRFCRYADSMLLEREFFIRKVIGWVLREVSKTQPDLVRAWVEPRLDRMSGVTRREALKYL